MKLLNNENVGDLGGEQRLISRLNPGLDSHKALMKDLEKYGQHAFQCKLILTFIDQSKEDILWNS